jgi:putative ABC transport system ATP-binding protein
MKTLIQCRDITKTYVNGGIEAKVLKGISFSIKQGEFVAIIGPSGSGKSTLMHILGALDTPTSGQYLLDGENVSKLSDNELAEIRGKKIGFVFQSFNLLQRATVMRNVQLPLVYGNIPLKDRLSLAQKALKDADLETEKHQNRSNQLSGGQMQRVAIARALVNNPAILLADEPTGNLDQKTGRFVLDTFQRLNNSGRTIILITHDQYVAEHANRIIQIRDGAILEDRSNTPQHSQEVTGATT